MAYRARIRCINKSNRQSAWERITHVGGLNSDGTRWRQTVDQTIGEIERGEWTYYVERPAGDRVDVIVSTSAAGRKYLKTTADGDQPNNLLSLPECP